MNDVRGQPPDHACQPPPGGEIHLGAGRDGNEVEPFLGSPAKFAVRMGDKRGPLAERPEAVDRQQDLVLTASPGTGCIDVEENTLSPSRRPKA